jgi:hypothetical protein
MIVKTAALMGKKNKKTLICFCFDSREAAFTCEGVAET